MRSKLNRDWADRDDVQWWDSPAMKRRWQGVQVYMKSENCLKIYSRIPKSSIQKRFHGKREEQAECYTRFSVQALGNLILGNCNHKPLALPQQIETTIHRWLPAIGSFHIWPRGRKLRVPCDWPLWALMLVANSMIEHVAMRCSEIRILRKWNSHMTRQWP